MRFIIGPSNINHAD